MKIFIIAIIVVFATSAFAQEEIRKQPSRPSVDASANEKTKSILQGHCDGTMSPPVHHQSTAKPNVISQRGSNRMTPTEPKLILPANSVAPAPISIRHNNGVEEKTVALPSPNKMTNSGSSNAPVEHSPPAKTEQK